MTVLSCRTSPGDIHLTCVNGYFGERHCDMASRYGADVRRIERPWGEVFTLAEIEAAINQHKPQILWLCYGAFPTSNLQPALCEIRLPSPPLAPLMRNVPPTQRRRRRGLGSRCAASRTFAARTTASSCSTL